MKKTSTVFVGKPLKHMQEGGASMELDLLTVHRMQSGDTQTVEDFVRQYYPQILRYCYLHIFDRGDAEDMTQETFARFFRNLDQYRHNGKLRSCLYAIAANVCRDYHRKRKDLLMDQIPEEGTEPMPQVELRLDVRRALERLPREQRDVVVLYYFQGCRKKEIGQILGIGESLVRYRLKRAADQLREFLGEDNVWDG